MKRLLVTAAAAAVLAGATALWAAGSLESQAKVGKEQATGIALRAAPGKVQDAELEREGGRLVWSFDIKRANMAGVTEVQVDALTGEIVVHKVESPAEEAAEQRAEKAERKAGR